MAYRRGQRRFRKRWYVNAQIGKSVPFIGGTGITAGSGRYQKRNLANYVKRQVVKQEETKELVRRVAGSLNHGTVYNLKLNDIPQGTSSGQRIGDSVFYCGMNLKITLFPALPNSHWRIYVVKARQSNASTDATHFEGSNPVIGASLMFRNSDIQMDSLLNTDDVNVICSKVMKIDQKFTGETNITRQARLNCRIMKKFQFQTGQQAEGEYYNYYLVILPISNVSGSQTTTTNVGTFAVTVEQVFKDA